MGSWWSVATTRRTTARRINLLWRAITQTARWRLTKTWITDPTRPTVLGQIRFEALTGRPRRLYVLADPAPGRIKGAYWEGSVLLADLSGFTALSEKHSSLGKQGAEEVSAIINNLFGAMLEELHRYRGGLLKFGGDAITAFFDAATLDEQHAALACRAALAMQARMAEFAALVPQ